MTLDHTSITPFNTILEVRKLFDIMAWQRPTKIVLPAKSYKVFEDYVKDHERDWDAQTAGLTANK